MMLQAKIGDTVTIHFTCTREDGTIFDSSYGKQPLQFTIGINQIIPDLEQAVAGMSVGESKVIEIPGEKVQGLNDRVDEGKLTFNITLIDISKPTQANADEILIHGNILAKKGQLDEAVSVYQKALRINPNFDIAYNNLGNVLKEKGQFLEAVNCYQRALQIQPACDSTYNNLGTAFECLGRFEEAISCYQKALEINPHCEGAYYNLGNAFAEQGKLKDALDQYQLAVKHNPEFLMAQWALCMSQLPIIYPDPSSIWKSRENYHETLKNLNATISLETADNIHAAAEAVASHQPFNLACQALNDRELQRLYGDLVCQIMAKRYPQLAKPIALKKYSPHGQIRVGIVSKYFFWHSVWKIPLRGWIEQLDKDTFSIYGYHTGKIKDHVTETARKHCTKFVADIFSLEKLCSIIRNDNLHVLIYPEIGMDPMTLRLAALRLAPSQCTSLGHPDTSGLPTIDYYLSSELMEPSDADKHYTEKLIRLPNIGFSYIPFEPSQTNIKREDFGLNPQSTIYLCSHALFTHLPQHDELYPRIAREVGNCQFVFISYRTHAITEQFLLRIKEAFHRHNLSAEEYIVMLPRLNQEQYYALNTVSDVFLDTIGWSANNSTFEAISCNLPIVTLPGGLMRQRHCTGILNMMGMNETIASSIDEYIILAAKLGKDPVYRNSVSNKIVLNKHRIYRDRSCIVALENFLKSTVIKCYKKSNECFD